MSEEEIIKCAEFLGNRKDETTIKIDNDFYDERDIWKGLLDLYNKEKEKNTFGVVSKDKIKDLFKKYENEHFIPKAEIQKLLEK